MYAIYFVETGALALLCRDAVKGYAKSVSTQMVVGLTLSIMATMLNLPARQHRTTKICVIIAGSIVGTICSAAVFKTSEIKGEDNIIIGRLQGRISKLVPYFATFVMGLVALFVACHFSITEMVSFMQKDVKATSCTFQNYLHAFALLPQLVLCRRQGFVCPATVKFLFLIGMKHIYEFTTDAYVSWVHYQKGRLDLHEFSFMSGDFLAAIILLDFLYLVVTSDHKLRLIAGESELNLIEDVEGGVLCKETSVSQKPAKITSSISLWQRTVDSVGALGLAKVNWRKLVGFSFAVFAAISGIAFGIIKVYPVIFASVGYLGWRRMACPEVALPMHSKQQKRVL